MSAIIKEDLKMLKIFWEGEVVASEVYSALSKTAKGERKKHFLVISNMEKSHAKILEGIAESFGMKFRIPLRLRLKILFRKILARIMPLTFVMNYLEERSAIIAYSKALEKFKDFPELYSKVKQIIYDEIEHEFDLANLLTAKSSYVATIKDAIYGMTDSLVEILALVIGSAGIIADPIVVGLIGLIASIGGSFSMTAGAYLSAKSERDVLKWKLMEVNIKKNLMPETLSTHLKSTLLERGIEEESAKVVVDSIGNNVEALSKFAEAIITEESPPNPVSVAKITGIYYILGALPAIIPFFIGGIFNISVPIITIIAIGISSIITFIAGIFTAILSGEKILRKATLNVLIVIGAAMAAYGVATLARILLGIEIL
ncbi:MAG: VIT1/CCC1 transporter family protein [Candidatus Korarchaeota archaeon]|nr:VIT1/CCC1 transporter family protein [Thermoproteota archaeon]MCR8463124.1 VIT1/CCC1 transporter family protein [Thermoproteota archaeon]MCR8471002.1 VIT1/CCC1 transporter family protein [Thermoproteota archaeon]MCR8472389.1 VIT1/CCC1 transporter family protein [Thermoproteota archaeon]MCR8473428.1 VIT1/CCC1 transporter family protein [Thermoproteota archaeon]